MTESVKAVLNAWASERFASSGAFRARDGKVSSYGKVIGETIWEGNRKVLKMVDLGTAGVTRTTSRHINAAEHFATVWNRHNS